MTTQNTSKKVVLVYPRHTKGWEAQPWVDMPLGLLCIGTPLRSAGYDVKIIDQRIDPKWRDVLDKELKEGPICVGISTTTGPQLKYALEVSKIAKEQANVPVVWGGVHPSVLPEQTLQDDNVDIVVQREGEETFLELVQALEKKKPLQQVKGIWYKEDSTIRDTGDRPFIDLNKQLPLAWDLIETDKYIRTVFGADRLSFFTSRGCSYDCGFCFSPFFHKRQWRYMDVDIVIERIKDFMAKCKVNAIFLTDCSSFIDMEWARELLKAIIKNDLNIVITRMHVTFSALVKFTEEDFELLDKAGCRCISIGIESGSERIRTLANKHIDVDRLLEINRSMSKYAFTPLYFFMVGFPTETKEDVKETISLFSRLMRENPNAAKSVNIYTPFPGTALFDLAVKQGLEVPQSVEEWSNFNYRNVNLLSDRSREMKQILEVVDFCAFFADKKSFIKPFKKTNKFVKFLSNVYAPIARKRLENLYYRFPVEVKLAKFLRLYAKQS